MGSLRRMLIPPVFTAGYLFIKNRSLVSFRSEVELSPNLELGRKVAISSYCIVKSKEGPLRIGDRTTVSSFGCLVSGEAGLSIGNDCLIGPGVTMIASNHVYAQKDLLMNQQGFVSKGIVIEDNTWISAGCMILDGAHIGSGSIVTPNSVVGGRIPPYSIVSGNPAEVVFTRR